MQATEELAHGVDSNFDWESEASELRQCILKQERNDLEHKLWNSWESCRQSMEDDAERLHDDAFKVQHSVSFFQAPSLELACNLFQTRNLPLKFCNVVLQE